MQAHIQLDRDISLTRDCLAWARPWFDQTHKTPRLDEKSRSTRATSSPPRLGEPPSPKFASLLISPEREMQTPTLITHATTATKIPIHTSLHTKAACINCINIPHNLNAIQSPNPQICTIAAYIMQTSIIIIHLGKNTNRTIPKYPTPNSSHVEHESSW